jgi:hypothetical protein
MLLSWLSGFVLGGIAAFILVKTGAVSSLHGYQPTDFVDNPKPPQGGSGVPVKPGLYTIYNGQLVLWSSMVQGPSD